ncbi:hypothetical protein AB3S75_043598 [Citrus x aurantiifolia]
MRNHHPSLSKPDDDLDPIRPPMPNLTLSADVGLRKKVGAPMAPSQLNRPSPGGGGWQARHHAVNGSPRPRPSDPGSASLVPVNRIGSRTGHSHQLGAHESHYHA